MLSAGPPVAAQLHRRLRVAPGQTQLNVPEGVPFEDFVAASRKAPVVSARPETVTAKDLFDQYLKTHTNGTAEENSLGTALTHLNQLTKNLGERFRAHSLPPADFQARRERVAV